MPQAAPRAPILASDHTPRIVGIGASAGGLSALELFFSQAPVDSGLAYVVVQHMDPQHKPLLSHLLQRVTPMPVQEAVDGLAIERNAVYVIPPNHELTVDHGLLRLGHLQPSRGKRLPVDVLFGSLARDQGARAIGVVLSGMGADGTLVLMDEVLTPDSSRYWPAESYAEGANPPSYDKQFLRDWLETAQINGKPWDKTPPAPRLPREVIENTAAKYEEAMNKLMA